MTLPPKKSLGQHFLHHTATLEKIASLAKVSIQDQVLEIGPGPGGLTRVLAQKAQKLVAIEKDERFMIERKQEFLGNPSVRIIQADALAFDYSTLGEGSWKVVANLPYNVATEIIFRLLSDAYRHHFTEMYLMVQKEVADRIVATPAQRKDYSVLSLMSQIYSENKIVMKLSPGAFKPPPKVDSAIVHFKLHLLPRYPLKDFALFKKIVQKTFSQRRKKMMGPLKSLFPDMTKDNWVTIFEKSGIGVDVRPEEVPLPSFCLLANEVWTALNSFA